MDAYVLNLDDAKDRWTSIEREFSGTDFRLRRISAVDGRNLRLPLRDYAERWYHRFHGRSTNLREVGCYLTHVKAIAAFGESGDDVALIAEDDICLNGELDAVVREAVRYAAEWDILRLTGLSNGAKVELVPLSADYRLCGNLGRLKGAGAYLINRRAARALATALLPMRLPFDHAIDREWCFGLRAASVFPFPVSQTERKFRTSIQIGDARRLSTFRRWLTTYPYQAYTEVSRWVARGTFILLFMARRRRDYDEGFAAGVNVRKTKHA